MNTKSGLLGDLSAEQFLEEYWQKKPLLVRQAFPDFKSPLTAEEIGEKAMKNIAQLSIPNTDPLFGEKGFLVKTWREVY